MYTKPLLARKELCPRQGGRWLEAAIDERGNSYLILAGDDEEASLQYLVECSLENLWTVLRGLHYQAVSDEGYVALRRCGDTIVTEHLRSGEEIAVVCEIPLESYVDALTTVEESSIRSRRYFS